MPVKYEGAVTFSRLRDSETCGLQFQLRHIEKRKEPDNAAFAKGSRVHDHIEQFLKGRVQTLPDEAERLAKKLIWLKKQPGLRGEEAWGFDAEWAPLPVTGYFSKFDYVRAKVDALLPKGPLATVIDFKTGRVRETDVDQVRFYALLTLLRERKVARAALQVWYVEHGKIDEFKTIERKELDLLKDHYVKRIQKMLNKTDFKPQPGMHCRWCSFSKHKGGPCAY